MTDRACEHGYVGPCTECESSQKEDRAKDLWSDFMRLSALPWRPFKKDDWYAFAGAGKDAHICYVGDTVYIRSVDEGMVCFDEIDYSHPSGVERMKFWTFSVQG